MADTELFVSLAGVFVGFGALISVSSEVHLSAIRENQIRTVVSTGLMVILAALIPLGLERYGVSGHSLWLVSSLAILLISWAVIVLALRQKETRDSALSQARSNPFQSAVYWLLLELPIHVSLLLIVLGANSRLDSAFYLTALLFNLFQAVFVLTQFVYAQERT